MAYNLAYWCIQMAYTQHSWMLMDIVVGLSVRPSVRLFVYACPTIWVFFGFFYFFFFFFFLRLGLGQRRAVVIIGRWLLPSLVDTGDICCHYWQHILVFKWFYLYFHYFELSFWGLFLRVHMTTIAWCWPIERPLPEPILSQFNDGHTHHLVSRSWINYDKLVAWKQILSYKQIKGIALYSAFIQDFHCHIQIRCNNNKILHILKSLTLVWSQICCRYWTLIIVIDIPFLSVKFLKQTAVITGSWLIC